MAARSIDTGTGVAEFLRQCVGAPRGSSIAEIARRTSALLGDDTPPIATIRQWHCRGTMPLRWALTIRAAAAAKGRRVSVDVLAKDDSPTRHAVHRAAKAVRKAG